MIKAALEAYDHVDHADGIERALGRYAASGLSVAVETGGQTAWIHEVLIRSPRDVWLLGRLRSAHCSTVWPVLDVKTWGFVTGASNTLTLEAGARCFRSQS
jgi:hypothetical protein